MQADARGGLAIQTRRCGIGLGAQFNARDIPEANRGAISLGAQHDIAELLDTGKLPINHDCGGNALPRHIGQIANRAGRNLGVLGTDGICHVR